MATHSSIPWIEEPVGSQRVRHNLVTKQQHFKISWKEIDNHVNVSFMRRYIFFLPEFCSCNGSKIHSTLDTLERETDWQLVFRELKTPMDVL